MHKLLFAFFVTINLCLFVGFSTSHRNAPDLAALDSAMPLGAFAVGAILLTMLIYRVFGNYLSRKLEFLDTQEVEDGNKNYLLMTSFSLCVVFMFVPVSLALGSDNPAIYVYAIFMVLQAILTLGVLLRASISCGETQPHGSS